MQYQFHPSFPWLQSLFLFLNVQQSSSFLLFPFFLIFCPSLFSFSLLTFLKIFSIQMIFLKFSNVWPAFDRAPWLLSPSSLMNLSLPLTCYSASPLFSFVLYPHLFFFVFVSLQKTFDSIL